MKMPLCRLCGEAFHFQFMINNWKNGGPVASFFHAWNFLPRQPSAKSPYTHDYIRPFCEFKLLNNKENLPQSAQGSGIAEKESYYIYLFSVRPAH